jgi:hypothetical protein
MAENHERAFSPLTESFYCPAQSTWVPRRPHRDRTDLARDYPRDR